MKSFTLVAHLIIVVGLLSCQSPQVVPQSKSDKMKTRDSNLTREEALDRARGLTQISYTLNLQLDETSTSFAGTDQVDFFLQRPKDLFIDFKYGTVDSLTVNKISTKANHDGFRIFLPRSLLKEGKNSIQISYKQSYSKNGAGLYRFVDPLDKGVYLYTQFEANDAHQMFPCFDQPDLKATYKLEVTAPPSWTVISTSRESSSDMSGTKRKWTFPETPLLSTYVFSLHAGPYQVWNGRYKDIPLRLFARKSLAKDVVPDEWFSPLKYGLGFYADMFDYAYPFKKYDQLIVPDFNAGAMENVGAVTFSERFVRPGQKTKREIEGLAGTILHELAHMWFGDLVTMKWWNGLWLNESFATYISFYAMSKSKLYPDSWVTFGAATKNWAYVEDEWVTTHPIEVPIPDTLTTFTTFDGITYGKGASVLKQLNFYVGEEKFRLGLRKYFRMHQYGNTDINDFLGAIGSEAGVSLNSWSERWLQEAGLDTVRVESTCANDRYKSFELVQTLAPGSRNFRPHRSIVGLFDERNGKMIVRKQVPVTYQAERTSVPELIGQDCAAFVYPNVEDHDYVKVALDPKSLKTLGENLNKFADPLVRGLVWVNLFQMLRDQKIKLAEYTELATKALKTETHVRVIDKILDSVLGGRSGYYSVREFWPRTTEQQKKIRDAWVSELEKTLWVRTQRAQAGSDLQKVWLDAYVRAVESQAGATKLISILNGSLRLDGLLPDQDRRWDMIIKVAQVGHKETEKILAAEEQTDPSDKGIKFAMSARAAMPKEDQKERWFSEIVTNKELSLAKIKSVATSLNPYIEVDFKKYLNAEFYSRLIPLMGDRDQEYLSVFVPSLIPRGCESGSTEVLGKFVQEKSAQLTPGVSKPLRVAFQEETRCLKIRENLGKDMNLSQK